MDAAQVTGGQLAIDEHPEIVVAQKTKDFAASIEEANTKLGREPII